MSQVFGILGWPVEHSRSPAMQEAAFRALGIDATYERIAVRPEDLPAAIADVRERLSGANVTVPHKRAVMPLLDEVEAAARAIGAVNTLVMRGDRLIGANTDAPGLVRSLQEHVSLQGAKVVVLGAGGAARAAVFGMRAAGATVTVAARRIIAAEQLCDALGGEPCALPDVASHFERADLVVQATSATLGDGAEAFAASLPLASLPKHATVVDLVYVPRMTTVLRRAAERGLATIDGTGMLVHQGALAFERWTGQAAPIQLMREALLATLA